MATEAELLEEESHPSPNDELPPAEPMSIDTSQEELASLQAQAELDQYVQEAPESAEPSLAEQMERCQVTETEPTQKEANRREEAVPSTSGVTMAVAADLPPELPQESEDPPRPETPIEEPTGVVIGLVHGPWLASWEDLKLLDQSCTEKESLRWPAETDFEVIKIAPPAPKEAKQPDQPEPSTSAGQKSTTRWDVGKVELTAAKGAIKKAPPVPFKPCKRLTYQQEVRHPTVINEPRKPPAAPLSDNQKRRLRRERNNPNYRRKLTVEDYVNTQETPPGTPSTWWQLATPVVTTPQSCRESTPGAWPMGAWSPQPSTSGAAATEPSHHVPRIMGPPKSAGAARSRNRAKSGAAPRQLPGVHRTILRGTMYTGLRPIVTNPAIDPPEGHCFNCWQPGHGYLQCGWHVRRVFCRNCGRHGVDVADCPRCAEAHRKAVAEKNAADAAAIRLQQEINQERADRQRVRSPRPGTSAETTRSRRRSESSRERSDRSSRGSRRSRRTTSESSASSSRGEICATSAVTEVPAGLRLVREERQQITEFLRIASRIPADIMNTMLRRAYEMPDEPEPKKTRRH